MNILSCKYFLLLITLTIVSFTIHAQPSSFTKDTIQLNAWLKDVRPAMDTSTEAALAIIEKLKQLSGKLNVDTLTAKVLSEAGYYYFSTGDYKEAAVVWDSSARIWEKASPHSYTYARAVNSLGNAYMYNSEYNKALVTFFNALKISQDIKNNKSISQVYNNIGLVYESIGDYDNALLYGKKSLVIKIALGDSAGAGSTYGNIGNAFEVKKEPDSAIFYHKLSYQYASYFERQGMMANALGNIGHDYMGKKEWDSAVYYLGNAIAMNEKLGNAQNNANFLNLISYAYLQKNDFSNTERYAKKAAEYLNQITDKEFLQANYQLFYEYYKKTGDTKKALEYAGKLIPITDSLFKEKLNIQNEKMALSFEFKEKKSEDSLAHITSLNASKQKTLTARNKYTIALLLFLLAAAIATLLYSRSKILLKRNIVARQNIELNEQKIKELESEKQILASQAIVKGQEEERSRLAKDLHDGLGGLLSGVKHSIINMKENMIISGEHALVFEKSLNLIDTASRELRRVAQNMMPEALAKFGLETALNDYCAASCTTMLKVVFTSYGNDISIDKPSSIIIYRIVQELVNNAVKHADATQVMVQMVKGEDWITLGVEDNGKGFDSSLLSQSPGSGWSNIKSRVDYLKGNIDIKSQKDTGTSVSIEIKIATV